MKSNFYHNNVYHNKAFNIAKSPKYDGYQTRLACLVYKFFDKEFGTYAGTRINSNADSEIQQLVEELQKPKYIN